jgi:hypothetical protein
MSMYRLLIFQADCPTPIETRSFSIAKDVVAAIPGLLAAYPDCARMDVLADAGPLFSVDRRGARLG